MIEHAFADERHAARARSPSTLGEPFPMTFGRVSRRGFVHATVMSAAFGGSLTHCKSSAPRTRASVLSALVREVVVPNTREVVEKTTRLEAAALRFVEAPTRTNQREARNAWRRAGVAWKALQSFQNGPAVETGALARAAFWPPRTAAIEEALAGSTPIDERFVAELGADVKGLYALEHLLFPIGVGDEAAAQRFRDATGARPRQLLLALARSVAGYATKTGQVLGNGAGYAERFGRAADESLSLLVGQIIATIENLAVHRLDLVIGLDKNGLLEPRAIEGGPSGTSSELVVAHYLATERLYRGAQGGGIADLVSAAAPAVAERITKLFADATRAVRALTQPLEVLVKRDRPTLVSAVGALKMLEILLKLEASSTLGLTLTFPGGDGD